MLSVICCLLFFLLFVSTFSSSFPISGIFFSYIFKYPSPLSKKKLDVFVIQLINWSLSFMSFILQESQ